MENLMKFDKTLKNQSSDINLVTKNGTYETQTILYQEKLRAIYSFLKIHT